MSRYIDADEFWYLVLEKVFHEATDEYWGVRQCLDETPTADVVEVKHGSWNGIYDGYADGYPVYDEWECDCCGYIEETEEMPTWNYCPNCGQRWMVKQNEKH